MKKKRGYINLVVMGGTYRPGIVVLSRRLYHQWWPIGATLIVDGLEVAPVLPGRSFTDLERIEN